MRLLIIPLILVAILVQAPSSALGNNQEAAERIADAISASFPDADIDVAYQGGQVWLKGETFSQTQRTGIVELVRNVPGVSVREVNSEIHIVTAMPARTPIPAPRPVVSALINPAPIPAPVTSVPAPIVVPPATQINNMIASDTRQMQPVYPQQHQLPPQPQTAAIAATMAPYPYQYHPAAYGVRPGQQPAVAYPYLPTSYDPQTQAVPQHYAQQQYQPQQYQPAYHGPQAPLPGQYNQPNLPDYAWPAYANYPNYSQVSYPRSYSPKAWPYIGPFYPYPQVPMGWRKVTLEHNNGWWWLDFDDGTPSGPFSGLFRQTQQYRY